MCIFSSGLVGGRALSDGARRGELGGQEAWTSRGPRCCRGHLQVRLACVPCLPSAPPLPQNSSASPAGLRTFSTSSRTSPYTPHAGLCHLPGSFLPQDLFTCCSYCLEGHPALYPSSVTSESPVLRGVFPDSPFPSEEGPRCQDRPQ